MSPEQLRGDEVDGRSDLFSLGVVLYTVLTGYRPFQGNSAATVSFKVVNRDPVPASVLDTDLPPGLDYIIARAMAKDPSQRYQRGMEIVLDIQEMRAGREPWSKTKQQGAFAAVAAVQTASVRASAWATGQRAVGTKPGNRSSSLPLPPGRDGVEELLQKMGKRSLAGALVLAGVLAFGLQARHFIWPQKAPIQNLPRNTAVQTLPFSEEGAAAKDAPVVTMPSADPAPRLIANKLITNKLITNKLSANKLIANKPRATAAVASAPHATVSSATSPAVSPAMLDIEVQYKFAQAQLSIWVDDSLTYTHLLEGADKKRLVVFHKVEGHEFHAVQISPGKHKVRVRVESSENSYDQSDTVAGDFLSGKENMLRINFGKHGEMQLSLQ
jgi:serine/threonine-protein kinase